MTFDCYHVVVMFSCDVIFIMGNKKHFISSITIAATGTNVQIYGELPLGGGGKQNLLH